MEAVRKDWSIGESGAGTGRGRLVHTVLLLLNVALALAIWLQWGGAPRAGSAFEVPAASAQPLQLPSSPLRTISLDDYQELVNRPLFWSERRALESESPVEESTVKLPLSFVLIGVVMSPQSNHALLGKPGSEEVTKVQPGDIVEGWQIESMTADSVRLTRGGESHQLTLDEERGRVR